MKINKGIRKLLRIPFCSNLIGIVVERYEPTHITRRLTQITHRGTRISATNGFVNLPADMMRQHCPDASRSSPCPQRTRPHQPHRARTFVAQCFQPSMADDSDIGLQHTFLSTTASSIKQNLSARHWQSLSTGRSVTHDRFCGMNSRMTLLYPVVASLCLLFPRTACVLWGTLVLMTWWQRSH